MNYLKQRINATYQRLNLTELDTIEKHCTIKNIKQMSKNEVYKLTNLIETLYDPKWIIVNRHVLKLTQKINKYAKKS